MCLGHTSGYFSANNMKKNPDYMGLCTIFLLILRLIICVPNETEKLNLSVFNVITGINESNVLTPHVSCKCKCKFGGRKCNSAQKWNNDKC